MACRAGRQVDRMLAEFEPHEFDEVVAFRNIEPDPDEHLRDILKQGLAALCARQGAKVTPDMFDRWAEQKPVVVSPREAAARFADNLRSVGIEV